MSETDVAAAGAAWGDEVGVGEELPTGTVTLLLADIEGSTPLWENEPEAMTAAIAALDGTVNDCIGSHRGVRPVEQGEGDSFVLAFARASDAVACALDLQRAPLAPIRLRIGLHTGDVQLRDEGNYVGPTPNRAGRVRDLAHGGQTVLSGTTHDLVVDQLPEGAWLRDLGTHPLRGLERPERVLQLCHADLPADFPPLRAATSTRHNLPAQLTSFIGRGTEIVDVRALIAEHRLVTLTGAGGAGKTRLAFEVAAESTADFADGVWYVDLAPITDADVVVAASLHALGLRDDGVSSPLDILTRFVVDRELLIVLDNCEHLLDESSTLAAHLLAEAPLVRFLTTSREPLGVAGECTWRVPSLSLDGDAVQLFTERALRARPEFRLTAENSSDVAEICRRLDGMPLAIELAAARVRALSPNEILASLHDRFRLLTGGARTAVRRQQTLRASVDWSHELLTEPDRVLFRRVGAFMGGFDLEAAEAVCAGDGLERYQVIDQLSSLIDKSLVTCEDGPLATRYRLLETVRQYALEKLASSGEADAVRTRHRDFFTASAARLDAPDRDLEQMIAACNLDIDNFRAAFAWSHEAGEIDRALQLASSLQPVWLGRGRIGEGRAWYDTALCAGSQADPALRARALAQQTVLQTYLGSAASVPLADEAVAIATELGDQALLALALFARGTVAIWDEWTGQEYFEQAAELAESTGQRWLLCQVWGFQSFDGVRNEDWGLARVAGERGLARVAGERGLALADAVGDRFVARQCRTWTATSRMNDGELEVAATAFAAIAVDAAADHDLVWQSVTSNSLSFARAHQGQVEAARASASTAAEVGHQLGGIFENTAMVSTAHAAAVLGDVAGMRAAADVALRGPSASTLGVAAIFLAESEREAGNFDAALAWTDEALAIVAENGRGSMWARLVRARVALARGDAEQADRDAHDALERGAGRTQLLLPDVIEFLAGLAGPAGRHEEAARLFGAAEAFRRRMGMVRFGIYERLYQVDVAALRDTMDPEDLERAWTEGTALSIDDAVAYARRGRGERKRPDHGWASLTPTEHNVVALVGEGLPNKEIAARLFMSPRTVQSHLTHVYTKLGLSSRVQLAQEAVRRATDQASSSGPSQDQRAT